ncbi:hypothetical protein DFH06DRAFT_1398747 [Mycena polygramma]|nr:hypothetical protein DFH06DRAFT_1398747 [Mycena polygramma]
MPALPRLRHLRAYKERYMIPSVVVVVGNEVVGAAAARWACERKPGGCGGAALHSHAAASGTLLSTTITHFAISSSPRTTTPKRQAKLYRRTQINSRGKAVLTPFGSYPRRRPSPFLAEFSDQRLVGTIEQSMTRQTEVCYEGMSQYGPATFQQRDPRPK